MIRVKWLGEEREREREREKERQLLTDRQTQASDEK